jgi:aromatic-L-amino-acid/L-tryptophan decarboxylase
MGVVCFRFIGPASGVVDAASGSPSKATIKQIDKLNNEIVERINASGRAYLTQAKLRGRTVMRIGLGNILTTERHLRNVWSMIQETAGGL